MFTDYSRQFYKKFRKNTMLLSVCALFLLISCVKTLEIQCDFYLNTWFYIPNEVYTCTGTATHSEKYEVTKIRGKHEGGKSNANVEALINFYQPITAIPRNIAEFFPNLKGLNFDGCKISSISAEDLQPFPELISFSIYYNKIVSIDSDLFKNTPKLVYIGFDGNQLQHIGNNSIASLTMLQEANFRGNSCIDMKATSPEVLEELKLTLANNCTNGGNES